MLGKRPLGGVSVGDRVTNTEIVLDHPTHPPGPFGYPGGQGHRCARNIRVAQAPT